MIKWFIVRDSQLEYVRWIEINILSRDLLEGNTTENINGLDVHTDDTKIKATITKLLERSCGMPLSKHYM